MGRRKIIIEPIEDDRNRHVTFTKRKNGLMKKAMELSILCKCQISIVIFNTDNQLFEYSSTDPRFILQRYCQVAHLPHERLSNEHYDAKYNRKLKSAVVGETRSDDGSIDAETSVAAEEIQPDDENSNVSIENLGGDHETEENVVAEDISEKEKRQERPTLCSTVDQGSDAPSLVGESQHHHLFEGSTDVAPPIIMPTFMSDLNLNLGPSSLIPLSPSTMETMNNIISNVSHQSEENGHERIAEKKKRRREESSSSQESSPSPLTKRSKSICSSPDQTDASRIWIQHLEPSKSGHDISTTETDSIALPNPNPSPLTPLDGYL